MWSLAADAWSFAGRALPSYTRADVPVRVIRASSPDLRSSSSD
jgi:hypothetical protein